MDRERLDLILDGQLRNALSVKPSAGFTARLRERLAEQPCPERFSWRWPVFASAIAASLALAVGIVFMRPSPPQARMSARTAPQPPPTRSTLVPAHKAAPSPAKAPVFIRRARAAVPSEAEFRVEVMVPPGQAEAIQRFARNLSEGSVSGRQLLRVIEVFEGELPQVPSYDVKGNER